MENELVKVNIEGGIIKSDEAIFEDKTKKFCTMDLNDNNNKIALYNSLQQCDVRLNDIKGTEISMKEVYIEQKEIAERDEKTGEIIIDENGEVKTKTHFRTIIFDIEGKTYVSSAYGIYNSLKTIIPVFGNPSADNIIKVKVGTKPTRTGRESLILTVVR